MRTFPGGRGSFIALGLAASSGPPSHVPPHLLSRRAGWVPGRVRQGDLHGGVRSAPLGSPVPGRESRP